MQVDQSNEQREDTAAIFGAFKNTPSYADDWINEFKKKKEILEVSISKYLTSKEKELSNAIYNLEKNKKQRKDWENPQP